MSRKRDVHRYPLDRPEDVPAMLPKDIPRKLTDGPRGSASDSYGWLDERTKMRWCRFPGCHFYQDPMQDGAIRVLNQHYRYTHLGRKPPRMKYLCDWCDWISSSPSLMQRHNDQIHTWSDSLNKSCPNHCERAYFASSRDWTAHVREYCPERKDPEIRPNLYNRRWDAREGFKRFIPIYPKPPQPQPQPIEQEEFNFNSPPFSNAAAPRPDPESAQQVTRPFIDRCAFREVLLGAGHRHDNGGFAPNVNRSASNSVNLLRSNFQLGPSEETQVGDAPPHFYTPYSQESAPLYQPLESVPNSQSSSLVHDSQPPSSFQPFQQYSNYHHNLPYPDQNVHFHPKSFPSRSAVSTFPNSEYTDSAHPSNLSYFTPITCTNALPSDTLFRPSPTTSRIPNSFHNPFDLSHDHRQSNIPGFTVPSSHTPPASLSRVAYITDPHQRTSLPVEAQNNLNNCPPYYEQSHVVPLS